MIDKALLHAMGGKGKKAAPKHLKHFEAKEQHDGSYHVKRHSGHPGHSAVEHSAANLNEVQEALEAHMGQPNEGEAEAEPMQASSGNPVAAPGGEVA